MIKLGGLVTLKPINEAEYTHIGYGKYKEKGKEKDSNAPTFKKDDNGKFTPISAHAAAAKDADVKKDAPKVNIFSKDKEEPKKDTSSDSSEPDYDKYTNKSQTMTDFFKGNLSIDGLTKVAKKNFDSEIATERDLDGFLNNKFMQDVMADEHGVDKDTLISKVKDLKAAMFGGDKEEPKSEPSQPKRQGNPQVNKATLAKAKKLGITPEKLGKEEYQKKMAQAAIEALTDSNFHSEARQLVADLEGKPELAEKPDYPKMDDPKFKEKMDAIRTKYASQYSDDVEDDARDLGISASQEAGWGGVEAADSIAFTLRMNGFHKLADTIQSVFDNKGYMKQEGRISLKKL